jgi:hypothetical protein
MPLYSTSIFNRRKVRIKTGGTDQMSVCPPAFIYLEGSVNDYTNLRNHVFEWVQVSGPATTLIRVDEMRSYFAPSLASIDQTFRFYIDRGTTNEQFDELVVYYTPTSSCKLDFQASSVSRSASAISAAAVSGVQSEGLEVPPVFRDNVSGIAEMKIEPVMSDDPGFYGLFDKLEVLGSGGFGSEPLEVVKTFRDTWPEDIRVPFGSYKLRVHYKSPINKAYYSKLLTLIEVEAEGGIGSNDLTRGPSYLATVVSPVLRFTSRKLTPASTPGLADNSRGPNFAGTSTSAVSRFTFSKLTPENKPELQDIAAGPNLLQVVVSVVSRFSSGNVGNN